MNFLDTLLSFFRGGPVNMVTKSLPQTMNPVPSRTLATNNNLGANSATKLSLSNPPTISSTLPINLSTAKMSAAGLLQTRYCEGEDLVSYRDSRGVWTIGYGRIEYDGGKHVGPNEKCTAEQAEAWLLEDVENDGSHYVRAWVKFPLTQNQFDALSDFTFNRGAGRLKTLLSMSGNIADNFITAVPDDTELGLRRRRQMNRAMYNGADWTAFKEWEPT